MGWLISPGHFSFRDFAVVSTLLVKCHTPVISPVRSVLYLTLVSFVFIVSIPSCLSPTPSALREGPLRGKLPRGVS